jgi:hypothetical protein
MKRRLWWLRKCHTGAQNFDHDDIGTSRWQLRVGGYSNFQRLRKRGLAAGYVQVFGRRNAEPIHALRRPASEKRQGTKSR